MAAVTYSLDIHYLWQVDVLHFLCLDLMKEEFLLVSEYFLLGSPSLSSIVDLPVEGLFAFSSGRFIVRISRPGSLMAFLDAAS